MAVNTAHEFEQRLDKIGQDLWTNGGHGLALDGVLQKLLQLQVQTKVQQVLETTAKTLRNSSRSKKLPNQLAIRVKEIIKYVFEKTTRDQERQRRLRELDFNALKFCGLSYKIKDILELPGARFDFLIDKVASYVQIHSLSQYLYRDDINKAVFFGDFNPDDDELFKDFLKCLFHLSARIEDADLIKAQIELRPAKRKRDDGVSIFSSQPIELT